MLNGLKNKTFVQSTIRNTFRGSAGISEEIFILIHCQEYLQQQVKKMHQKKLRGSEDSQKVH